jgi:hypothetical protein
MNQPHKKHDHAETHNPSRQTDRLLAQPASEPASATRMTKPHHEQIAERAHGIWQRGGSLPDQELETWLKAEGELTDESAKV